jgi:hypothetical protein
MVYTAHRTTDIFRFLRQPWRRTAATGELPMKPFSALQDSPAPVIGTWSQFAGPEAVDIPGGSGFAFIIVDTEHGHCCSPTIACSATKRSAPMPTTDGSSRIVNRAGYSRPGRNLWREAP